VHGRSRYRSTSIVDLSAECLARGTPALFAWRTPCTDVQRKPIAARRAKSPPGRRWQQGEHLSAHSSDKPPSPRSPSARVLTGPLLGFGNPVLERLGYGMANMRLISRQRGPIGGNCLAAALIVPVSCSAGRSAGPMGRRWLAPFLQSGAGPLPSIGVLSNQGRDVTCKGRCIFDSPPLGFQAWFVERDRCTRCCHGVAR
jgi:hypothetical protein